MATRAFYFDLRLIRNEMNGRASVGIWVAEGRRTTFDPMASSCRGEARGLPRLPPRASPFLGRLTAGIDIEPPRFGVADDRLFFTNAVLCMKMTAPIGMASQG